MIQLDFSELRKVPHEYRQKFINYYGKKALERVGVQGSNAVKNKITTNQSVQTGNLRNSVWFELLRTSKNLLNMIIYAGGFVSNLSNMTADGRRVKNPHQPSSYADVVEAKKPYLEPTVPEIEDILQTEMNAALEAWTRSINK